MKHSHSRFVVTLAAVLLTSSFALLNISADPTAIVTIQDGSAAEGRSTTVKLSVLGVPEPGLSDLQGSLTYDPEVVHVESIEGLNDYRVFAFNADNDLGRVRFVVAKVSGRFLREGKIIQFRLRAVGQVGDRSLLELDLEAFNDPDGSPIDHRDEDGNFSIKAQQAIFTFLPEEPIVNQTVQFIDQSVGEIVRWMWDFGDGEGSTEQNPTHKYSRPGTYTVQLLVEDNAGAKDITSEDITVRPPNQPPQADFSFSPTNPKVNDSVRFTDESADPDGTIESWSWNFGDGNSSSVQNPTHKYSQAGTYTVRLTVTDNEGASGNTSKQVIVGGGQPQADFSFSPANPKPGGQVQFTDKSSDPNGEIVSWSWQFGDGRTSTEQSPSHRYSKQSTYTVKLTVTDNDGLTDSATKQVIVGQPKPTVSVHCFPNPASNQTTFKYSLPSGAAQATLRIFDIIGKLMFHYELNVTVSQYAWDLKSDGGLDLPNGPYFYYIITFDTEGRRIARSDLGKLVIQRS